MKDMSNMKGIILWKQQKTTLSDIDKILHMSNMKGIVLWKQQKITLSDIDKNQR